MTATDLMPHTATITRSGRPSWVRATMLSPSRRTCRWASAASAVATASASAPSWKDSLGTSTNAAARSTTSAARSSGTTGVTPLPYPL